MTDVMKQVCGFALHTTYEDLPEEALRLAKVAFVDYMGVTLSGAQEDAAKFSVNYACGYGARPESTIWGRGVKTHMALAALCNGVASHANDYDDCSDTEIGHPSITVLPAVFAVGEAVGATGRDLLRAYLIGVEVQNKLSVLALPETSQRGWHTMSVFGHLGAATAAGVLLGLSEGQLAAALGIACSQACGLRANFGTMTKPYHAGHASADGVEAALLARDGMTSGEDILENVQGFVRLFSGREVKEGTDLGLGRPWDIVSPGFQIKLYPSCSASHPATEAMFALMEAHPELTSDNVESIHAGIGLLGINELICHRPTTPDEARFSMEYELAAAVTYGRLTLDEFRSEAINQPEVQALVRRVTMSVDEELAQLGLTADEPCKLTVTLKDGTVLKERCMLAKGQPKRPLSVEELRSKFMNCAGRSYSETVCADLFGKLLRVEEFDSVEQLLPACM